MTRCIDYIFTTLVLSGLLLGCASTLPIAPLQMTTFQTSSGPVKVAKAEIDFCQTGDLKAFNEAYEKAGNRMNREHRIPGESCSSVASQLKAIPGTRYEYDKLGCMKWRDYDSCYELARISNNPSVPREKQREAETIVVKACLSGDRKLLRDKEDYCFMK